MKTYLTKAELKLMEVIWEKGQIPSNKLVKECLERFNWKKSTTYTNLKKLEENKFVKEVNNWGDICRYISEKNTQGGKNEIFSHVYSADNVPRTGDVIGENQVLII